MPQQESLAHIAALWKAEKSLYVKKSTLASYSYLLESHILPDLGGKTSVTEEDVQLLANEKIAGGLSRKSVHDILIVLNMVLVYAGRNGFMEYRPMQIQLPTKQKNDTVPTFTIEQQRILSKYLKDHPSSESIGLQICLFSGLRIGEICALRWKNVDPVENIIRIRQTIQRIYIYDDSGAKHTELVMDAPKSPDSIRDIPVPAELMRHLIPYKESAGDEAFVLSGKATPIEPRVYRTFYKRLLRRAGLPDVRFHALRHSFATRCIDSNCNYKTVSALLGHSNISTTLNLYVHPNMNQKRKVVEAMSAVLD